MTTLLVITYYSEPTKEEIEEEVNTLRKQGFTIQTVALTKPNPFGFDERTYSTYHLSIRYNDGNDV